MAQRLLAVLAGVLVVFSVGSWGRTVDVQGPQSGDTAAAVRALGDGSELSVPAGFRYQPEVLRLSTGDLAAVAPNGGCSSPFGGTSYGFTDACRQHDLGYDLLRYAESQGQPLGPWARRAIDAEFARQTLGGCEDLGCTLTAGLYVGAVEFNSWRQGYGVPRLESLVELLSPVLAGIAVGGALWLLMTRPRPRFADRFVLVAAGAR